MRSVPLLFIPFLLYNVFAFLILEDYATGFETETIFSVPMISGASFSLTIGAMLVIIALVLLGFEVLKSTRVGSATVLDHALATALFLLFFVEFLLVPRAATSTFLILMVVALVDMFCGFAVSLRSATRDVSVGGL